MFEASFGPSGIKAEAADPPPPVPKNYLLSNSPFSYDGVDYLEPDGPVLFVDGYAPVGHDVPLPLSGLNIDCGLYDAGEDIGKYTVYYQHGQKAALEALLPPGSCVTTAESIFIFTGGAYVYQGNPLGWTILEGWVIPPTLTEE